MKWTVLGLILVGIVAAGAAALLAVAIQAKGGVRAVDDPNNQEIEVLVATEDLLANSTVISTAVARAKARKSEAPDKALTNETQVIGQLLIADVIKGQVFTAKHFPGSESDVALTRSLGPGQRAMSIVLSSDTGIEEILYPGCLVDVVATFRLPPADGQGFGEVVSVTVLQKVYVMKVGQRSLVSDRAAEQGTSASEMKRGRMITLRVDTQQAEMLQLAVTQGTVSVSLRNPLDNDPTTVQGSRLEDLSKDLAAKIQRLNQPKDPSSSALMPPPVETTSVANAQGTPTTVLIEPEVEAEPELWPVQILRNGQLSESLRFPMAEALNRAKR